MLFLRNLSSSEIFSGVAPWEFTRFDLVPPQALIDKGFRDKWVNTPETEFHVYTLFEGVQSNLRLRGKNGGEDDNPPLVMHGLAVDYDTAMCPEQVFKAFPNLGAFPPNWFEQTLSGNGRLIWMFEQPLRLPSRLFAVRLLERLDGLIPFRKFAGIDEGCLKAPERYFTNGCRWTQISRKRIPATLLQGFVMKFAEKFDWQAKEFGKAVSLKDIEAELKVKFPGFASAWPGDFELGSSGPSFWVPGSTSPKSAIVRETGMHTFSAHATKAFYPWSELVGAEFVENNENIRLGKSVEGIYHDGRSFIVKDGNGKYAFHTKENMSLLLQVHRGLKKGGKRDGSASEVDRAIAHVLQFQNVDAAGSCAFYPSGVFQHSSRRILNTHQIEVMKPHPEPATWGKDGKFPFLSEFFDNFFSPVFPQKDRFLAWFKQHYDACLRRSPCSGHGVFIAGPVGCGKTFLNRGLMGTALGGFAEANSYLIGSDNHNSELFDHALWCIDDGSIASSDKIHLLFSENVKRTVANRDHRCNEKFRKAFQTPWQGRIVVTLNEDPESLRLIPNVDVSILEKLMLFRAGEKKIQFFSQPEMEQLLQRELPHFLRWLLDWTPPAHCFEGADVRFGLAPYAEPSLLQAANLSSGKSVFVEILTRWLKEFFTEKSPSAAHWEGTATELRMQMICDPLYAELLRPYRPDNLPRMMIAAANKGILKMEVLDDAHTRTFRILRDERFGAVPKTQSKLEPQNENSSFRKA
jgi:hypothetical protein